MMLTTFILIVSILWLITGSTVNRIERFWLTEPMIALLTGVVAGPLLGIAVIDQQHQSDILEWGAKLTISMALMVAALRFKHRYLMAHKQMLSVLTLGSMVLMFMVSVILSRYILNLQWPFAILIGAIITPTDPVVSSSMISGKYATRYLNNNLRSSLYFESGINDGLAFPLVAIGWMLIDKGHMDWMHWLGKVVLFENVLAAISGGIIGFLLGKLMHYGHRTGMMTSKTLLSFSVGVGFLVLTLLDLLKMNGIIGVFIAGLMFSRAIEQKEDLQEEQVQEAIERIFNIPMFFLIGVVLPFDKWSQTGVSLLLFVIAVLLLRRLPALIILKPFLRQVSRWPRVLLLGWFGPIGLAALLYSLMTIKKAGTGEAIPITMAVITASVLVHGITSFPLSKLYDKNDSDDVEGDQEKDNVEEE